MEIVAKTKDGCLITATDQEVHEILNAVFGKKPEKLEIGQKIPAIDYATTILKVKSLKSNYDFQLMASKVESFTAAFAALKDSVDKAADIEI